MKRCDVLVDPAGGGETSEVTTLSGRTITLQQAETDTEKKTARDKVGTLERDVRPRRTERDGFERKGERLMVREKRESEKKRKEVEREKKPGG